MFLMMSCPAHSDFFKWELQIFSKGLGTPIERIPVTSRGAIYKWGKKGECRITDSWTRIVSELTIECKTLVCENDSGEQKVNLVCRNNRGSRRYNRWKEIYPEPLIRFLFLDNTLTYKSPLVRFRCFF